MCGSLVQRGGTTDSGRAGDAPGGHTLITLVLPNHLNLRLRQSHPWMRHSSGSDLPVGQVGSSPRSYFFARSHLGKLVTL